MSRGLLLALIGGIASAILSIGSLGPAPIIAAGLSLGSTLGSIAAAVAALLILFLMNGINSAAYIVITAIPAMIIVRQALISQPADPQGKMDWYPPGLILAGLTAYGLIVLALATLYFAVWGSGIESASLRFLRVFFDQMIVQPGAGMHGGINAEQMAKLPAVLAQQMAPILPGMMITGSILVVTVNATIAQGLLKRIGHALRPSPAYAALELPRWLGAVLAAAVVAAFLPGVIGNFGTNAALVVSTPFFLLGLAVIHTLSRRAPKSGSVLAAIYVALFLLGVLLGLAVPLIGLIALLGFAEQWISLRQRFAAGGANQEDE